MGFGIDTQIASLLVPGSFSLKTGRVFNLSSSWALSGCELSNSPQMSASPRLQASAGPVSVGGVTDDRSVRDLTRTGLPGGDNWKTR